MSYEKRLQAFQIAERFTSIKEVGGSVDNPQIMAMLKLDNDWPSHDEVPWCSGFVNYVCWLIRLPRSKDLRARSWLTVGRGIDFDEADTGDIIVLKRGKGEQPGPDVIDAPGHVGFFAGYDEANQLIEVLGGNQSDTVKISRYHRARLLGIRRLT
jgi:uncharacterized protein (TIGR02594 family)